MAANCDRNLIPEGGDDAVTDSMQSFSANSLRENFMLKKHWSQSVGRNARLYDAPGDEAARVAQLDNRGIGHESLARARPRLVKSGFAPGRTDDDGLPKHDAWSVVFKFFMEGFALYGASMHPVAAFPVEAFLAQEEAARSELSAHPRRGSSSLVSPSAGPVRTHHEHVTNLASGEDGSVGVHRVAALDARQSRRWNWLTSPWAANVTRMMYRRRREREIKQAAAALAELDDRTLRDMGIPHRSQIEQTVRYCRDC